MDTQLKAIGSPAGTNIVSFFAPTAAIAAMFTPGAYFNVDTTADQPNNALLNPNNTSPTPKDPIQVIWPTK